jgi:hypothetical protein
VSVRFVRCNSWERKIHGIAMTIQACSAGVFPKTETTGETHPSFGRHIFTGTGL